MNEELKKEVEKKMGLEWYKHGGGYISAEMLTELLAPYTRYKEALEKIAEGMKPGGFIYVDDIRKSDKLIELKKIAAQALKD